MDLQHIDLCLLKSGIEFTLVSKFLNVRVKTRHICGYNENTYNVSTLPSQTLLHFIFQDNHIFHPQLLEVALTENVEKRDQYLLKWSR